MCVAFRVTRAPSRTTFFTPTHLIPFRAPVPITALHVSASLTFAGDASVLGNACVKPRVNHIKGPPLVRFCSSTVCDLCEK